MCAALRRHLAGLLCAGALAATAGCSERVTEIVLVVDSELDVPSEVPRLHLVIAGRSATRDTSYDLAGRQLPVTLGLLPEGAGTEPFRVDARGERAGGSVVVRAGARDVRFVAGERRMLVLTWRRACTCADAECTPQPGCDDDEAPALPPFSPAAIPPHVTPVDAGSDKGAERDAGVDAAEPDARADAPTDAGSDAGVDAAKPDAGSDAGVDAAEPDARADAPTDAGSDAAPDGPDQCTAGFGGCSLECAAGTYCGSQGTCEPGIQRGLFCQLGGCTCAAGLSCVGSDGSNVGTCQ